MKTICDTHALLYDFTSPKELSRAAAQAIQVAEAQGELACADISLWEIGMLAEKGRIPLPAPLEEFIDTLLLARAIEVLPITPAIAAAATSCRVPVRDPSDRLIAATAIVHGATLITRDRRLTGIPGLPTVW